MPSVSLRVPEDLKEKMDEHDDINWSAVIRSHLEEEIDRLDARNVGHAVATSERLSKAIDREDVREQNTAAIIREWRDTRYGASVE